MSLRMVLQQKQFDEGVAAQRKGVILMDNPYDPQRETAYADAWDDGWWDAHENDQPDSHLIG